MPLARRVNYSRPRVPKAIYTRFGYHTRTEMQTRDDTMVLYVGQSPTHGTKCTVRFSVDSAIIDEFRNPIARLSRGPAGKHVNTVPQWIYVNRRYKEDDCWSTRLPRRIHDQMLKKCLMRLRRRINRQAESSLLTRNCCLRCARGIRFIYEYLLRRRFIKILSACYYCVLILNSIRTY